MKQFLGKRKTNHRELGIMINNHHFKATLKADKFLCVSSTTIILGFILLQNYNNFF